MLRTARRRCTDCGRDFIAKTRGHGGVAGIAFSYSFTATARRLALFRLAFLALSGSAHRRPHTNTRTKGAAPEARARRLAFLVGDARVSATVRYVATVVAQDSGELRGCCAVTAPAIVTSTVISTHTAPSSGRLPALPDSSLAKIPVVPLALEQCQWRAAARSRCGTDPARRSGSSDGRGPNAPVRTWAAARPAGAANTPSPLLYARDMMVFAFGPARCRPLTKHFKRQRHSRKTGNALVHHAPPDHGRRRDAPQSRCMVLCACAW